jgi:hypothetical protein
MVNWAGTIFPEESAIRKSDVLLSCPILNGIPKDTGIPGAGVAVPMSIDRGISPGVGKALVFLHVTNIESKTVTKSNILLIVAMF